MVAWLQSQADLDANFFEETRKTLEKQNWDFFGGQLDKSVALTALGFVDGVCETIDKLALGAAQLGQLAFEGIEWGGNTLLKQKTPQWLKDDVTGAWNNVMAASEFGTRLIALDADAWNAVAKTGEKVGSDLASAIKTGDDYKIGGYLFDVATFVGPAAVGKLKYIDEASNLTKLAETSEVASTVGKVEDGVTNTQKLLDELSNYGGTVVKDNPKIYKTAINNSVTEINLQKLPKSIAETFTDSEYKTVMTTEEIKLYRTFGGRAKELGAFATTTPAQTRIDSKIETALLPEWGNSREFEIEITIPKGTILNIGKVAPQTIESTGTTLSGGADQILLPKGWPREWINTYRKVPNR